MTALAPIVGKSPKLIILGSMPSEISLREQQYYANPQNAFWWLMSELYGFSIDQQYQQRCKAFVQNSVAVWDVLADCQRLGSLDSSIVRSSERSNDFSAFLNAYPSIRLLAFNGGAAKAIFMRHCAEVFTQNPEINWQQLPSSSPAHASITRAQKLQRWRECLAIDIQ
ncbi:MAG: TDG/mug DNA glycosylase family protein [Cryomorphaceae bacterium]|jgi:TDG/mug DNA glycosylase family protein